MNITRNLSGVLAAIVLFGLLAAPALAADLVQFPDLGAPGDVVMIKGESFGDSPVVKFGGVEAEVVRSTDSRILCLVPDGADEGAVSLAVDGTATTADFTVLAEGTPVVLRTSAETATPGQRIYLVGRRLGGGEASFVDADGETQATVEVKGRRLAIAVAVPDDLAAGDYSLVIENGDGLDTGEASPAIEIVLAGTPELTGADPQDALPGRHLTLSGTDLGPMGACLVEWTDSIGDVLKMPGFANGYDEILTAVPFKAAPGETYEITARFRGDVETSGVLEYTVGAWDAPVVDSIDPEEGPAGSLVKLSGSSLLVIASKPEVEFTKDGESVQARILGAWPAFRDKPDVLMVAVPKDLEDGDYEVTVTVGDETSDAVTFTVGELDLAVSAMKPDGQGLKGSFLPVAIVGTGFGDARDGVDFSVVWDDGTDEFEGKVLFRSDRLILVAPPGDRRKPLGEGKYDVKVIRGEDSASAGTYTVG